MPMQESDRDPCLDTLLELHGQTFVLDEAGHWVKFRVTQVEVTPERPHGLSYSLTLHRPDGIRLAGFDNAHPVRKRQGPQSKKGRTFDHKHRFRTVRPYEYRDAAALIEDFWSLVDSVLEERGVVP